MARSTFEMRKRKSRSNRHRLRFKFNREPGRTHHIRNIRVTFKNNKTRTIGEWAFLLRRKPRELYDQLKAGVPLDEVLGGKLDRGRGDWMSLRREIEALGL